MRISLIYVQTVEGNNVIPPLGLMYLASVAKGAGHEVQLMDVDPDDFDVIAKLRIFNPDLIGLSFLTTEFEKACQLSYTIKKEFSTTPLCCGGVHTTVDTENVLRKFAVDFCVVGEGEMTLLEILKCLEQQKTYENIKGVCFVKDGQYIKNPPRALIKDLDSIPFPARDLVDYSNIYLTFPGVIRGNYIRSTVVMAGRGCGFNCSFCCVEKMFGRGYRLRSTDNILDEIEYLQKKYGVKGIYFIDSSLTSNKKWTMRLCEGMIKRGIKLTWAGNTRVDTVDRDVLTLMKKAGCTQIDYGVESGSPKILKIMNKRIVPEKVISTFKITKELGFRVGATFMIGNPDEEKKDLEMTFELAKKLNADYTVFFCSVPFPGTRLWEIARERNLLPEKIIYDKQWVIRQSEFPMLADRISREELCQYRAKFQNYFFRKNYMRLNNTVIALNLLWIMLKNPALSWNAIRKVMKYKRLDSLVEEVLVTYRKSLYRFY